MSVNFVQQNHNFFPQVRAYLRFHPIGVLDLPKNNGTSRHSRNLHKIKTNVVLHICLFNKHFLKKVQHGSQYHCRQGASLSTTLAQAGLTSTEADTWTLQSRDPTS